MEVKKETSKGLDRYKTMGRETPSTKSKVFHTVLFQGIPKIHI